MYKEKLSRWIILEFLAFALIFGACVDQDFDEPPTGGEPINITANTTIAELKQMHVLGEFEEITTDLIIKGTVIADDKSGNFFRAAVIQDETGGIEVRLNATDLYNDFPIGDVMYIRCNGLFLGDFNGLTQIGGSLIIEDGRTELQGIEPSLFDTYIVSTSTDISIPPLRVSIQELNQSHISTLIEMVDIQFVNADAGVQYADGDNLISLNRSLEDCFSNRLTLRTSGFADFANELTPTQSGSIRGVYSVFGSTKQMWLRDLNDISMTGDRCNSTPVTTALSESFDGLSDDDDINLNDWLNVNVAGDRLWRAQEFSGNLYAQATAFSGNDPDYEIWLITPGITMTGSQTLQFESAMAFWIHDGLSVWISTDFDGQNVGSANWTEVDCNLASNSDADHAWVDSGIIDLSAYSGVAHIGFKYIGTSGGNTTSYRIDNVVVQD